MAREHDITIQDVTLFFLPVKTRIPLKFGPEVTTHVTCARTCIKVADKEGQVAEGWGETPLSVVWVWPSSLSYEERHDVLRNFTRLLVSKWRLFSEYGHPMELGHIFQRDILPDVLKEFNVSRTESEPMPWLAALVCCSLFDLALHDAYGNIHDIPSFETYTSIFMNHDLSWYYTDEYNTVFRGMYPEDFFVNPVPSSMPAWHLIGGTDLLDESEATGDDPDDGYPIFLPDWIRTDGLKCLKVKLIGNDESWDYRRLVSVGRIALAQDVEWLTADFNCMVKDPAYVNEIFDRLIIEYPRIAAMILYVEQPFPYDLEKHQIDVHSVSARKPLFMDESAHDWTHVALGRKLGWSGVALKTCKTMTGALLSLCWAKAHGMTLMVQDLTNPMLAIIPHVLLAAYAGTIMGVETNSMQFYPDASIPESTVHPELYRRINGCINLKSITGSGFGYRLDEIKRILPDPELA